MTLQIWQLVYALVSLTSNFAAHLSKNPLIIVRKFHRKISRHSEDVKDFCLGGHGCTSPLSFTLTRSVNFCGNAKFIQEKDL